MADQGNFADRANSSALHGHRVTMLSVEILRPHLIKAPAGDRHAA